MATVQITALMAMVIPSNVSPARNLLRPSVLIAIRSIVLQSIRRLIDSSKSNLQHLCGRARADVLTDETNSTPVSGAGTQSGRLSLDFGWTVRIGKLFHIYEWRFPLTVPLEFSSPLQDWTQQTENKWVIGRR
jgi:hypothetical protein